MELDFSQLNNIGATQAGVERFINTNSTDSRENTKNLSMRHTDTLELNDNQNDQNDYPNIEKERAKREAIHQTYKQQQEYIRKAGALRAEITKGIQAGQDHYTLLLKAIECISVMTGDKIFLEQNKWDLENNLKLTFSD